MYISSRLGAVTPRIGFTRLVINGKYFGLYSVIERVNQNMVKKLLKHSNFDLLKSCSHDGNLKTVNDFNNKRKHDPTKGFELKHGNWKLLKEFEFWLESDKYSYEVLSSRISRSALLGFNLGYFYCGVSDSYSKNYYIVFDKNENKIFLIHWDSDASFGREWDGKQFDASNLICTPEHNGITKKIMENQEWKSEMIEEFSEAFDSYLLEQNVLEKIDSLETLLRYETISDFDVWIDHYKKNIKEKYWNFRLSDPEEIWRDELESIRNFVKRRREVIFDYLGSEK
jgi:spore coat protein CotH